ncbi:hypothetical protein, partial [Chryseobacterium sp. SIMBA_028]
SLKLIRDEVETLIHTKGGFGFGLQAKVKVDNIESSIELGRTKSQIKRLIDFYYKLNEYLSMFDAGNKESQDLEYKV